MCAASNSHHPRGLAEMCCAQHTAETHARTPLRCKQQHRLHTVGAASWATTAKTRAGCGGRQLQPPLRGGGGVQTHKRKGEGSCGLQADQRPAQRTQAYRGLPWKCLWALCVCGGGQHRTQRSQGSRSTQMASSRRRRRPLLTASPCICCQQLHTHRVKACQCAHLCCSSPASFHRRISHCG